MKPLYIIPARGGSKGIPRKNICLLGGKPLIAYTIDAALRCREAVGGFVLFSTDDEEIASVARTLGLDVDYMRPAELAADTSGSREVMIDAMDWADSHGVDYDCIVLLQPTSPLRTADDILGAMALWTPGCDMTVSVSKSPANPYYDLFETDADGCLHVCKGDGLITRRQDAPPVWQYNGAVYVITPASLRAMPMGAFARRIPYVMDISRSVDLDTLEDWQRAESLIHLSSSISKK